MRLKLSLRLFLDLFFSPFALWQILVNTYKQIVFIIHKSHSTEYVFHYISLTPGEEKIMNIAMYPGQKTQFVSFLLLFRLTGLLWHILTLNSRVMVLSGSDL